MSNIVTLKNSIIAFFKKNYGYFVASIFVATVFAAAQAAFGIYPFGDAIMASYDQLAQVCPIIEHYFRVLSGESGLFHTFLLGGGMDVFGILAYCTISPFTFLFLLGGQGNAVYAVSIVLPAKCICIACSALWFLKKHFPAIPQYVSTALALLYSFSGYLYVSNTYIVWVDLMIYCPLVLSGFISLIENGSVKMLAVSLTLMLYTCFSITCFSFFTVFPIFIIYIIVCLPTEKRKDKVSKLCLSFALAVAASLPVLLPAFKASQISARGTGLFTRVFENLSESQLKKGELFVHLYEKFTYIFCDAALICLTFVYFIRSDAGDKRARFMFIALVFLLIPCIVDESMLLLNMGSYYSYALRFGFLSGTFLTYSAALGINRLVEDGKWGNADDKIDAKSCVAAIVTAVLTALSAIIAVGLFNYIYDGKYENSQFVKRLMEMLNTEELPFKNFFACFAHSEGGLEAVSILFIVAAIAFAIIIAIAKFKLLKPAHIAPFLCIIALSQSVFYGFSLVKGDRQGGSGEKLSVFTEIGQILDERDDELFRVKNYDYYVSSDSPLITGLSAHTLFSSIADAKNLTVPVKYKYRGNSTNSTKSNGGSAFSDSLIGYKYVIYKKGDESAAKDRDYLTATDVTVGDYVVYENTACLPMAAVVDVGDGKFLDTDDTFAHIDGILQSFGAGLGATELEMRVFGENGDLSVSFDSPKKSDTFFVTFFPENMHIEGDIGFRYYGYSNSVKYTTASLRSADGNLTTEDVKTYCRAFAVKTSDLKKISAEAKKRAVDVKTVKNGFDVPTVTAAAGQYFYLAFTDIEGYEITVNGKRVETVENSSDFIYFPLEEGENEISIKYKSPYKSLIAVSAVIGAVLIAIIWLCYKKKPELFVSAQGVICVAAYLLAAALIVFFFIFPTAVGCYKFFFKYLKYLV